MSDSTDSGSAVDAAGVGRVQLKFVPSGQEVRVPPGVSVFDAASWNGLAIDSTCGGHGTCKKCKIQILEGEVPISNLDIRAFSSEQLADGWRLACVARANSNLKVDIPPLSTRPKAATVGVGRQVILRPAVQKRYVELAEPSLHDQAMDLERLQLAIDDIAFTVDLDVLKTLPTILRASRWKVTAVINDDVLIAVEPGDTTALNYAVAFDLGTTTVVATLLDLATGTPVSVKSMLNKQQPFGADVISRISATMMDKNAASLMQKAALDTLNELVSEVCAESGVALANIYDLAIAGNATMIELLLGIDPEPVGVAPFITVTRDWPVLRASEIGLSMQSGARCYIFPLFGAYVGGDIVAGALATGMDRDKRVRLLIDVGTNCEIVLSDGDKILATAAPAGPAFEAASISCGMRAADGAIEVIQITTEEVTLGVIGDAVPVGLCGSGLVDAVYALHQVGLIDDSGRFATNEVAEQIAPAIAARLITRANEERAFILAWEDDEPSVYLSQRDVRELQFAKASIATGWRLLLDELGLTDDDVQQVLLAGSFGSYLSPASAIGIGLVPKLPVARIVSAGNVAGEGAKMVLLSQAERHGANALLAEVAYVELSDRADFNDKFMVELALPS
ncbi:MAG: ASKHA domain-containing protein, partial [Actinomycetes bacterium]